MLTDNQILQEAAKIVKDNPINLDEDFLLDILQMRYRWPKNSVEVISNFCNPSESFFGGGHNVLLYDRWYELYKLGFTTMLNNCLDIHPDMRKLEKLLYQFIGEIPTGNIYMSSGTVKNRPSFDLHAHEYNVISTSIYGTTKWNIASQNKFLDGIIDIAPGEQVIIPSRTKHAVVDSPEKRCNLTLILG